MFKRTGARSGGQGSIGFLPDRGGGGGWTKGGAWRDPRGPEGQRSAFESRRSVAGRPRCRARSDRSRWEHGTTTWSWSSRAALARFFFGYCTFVQRPKYSVAGRDTAIRGQKIPFQAAKPRSEVKRFLFRSPNHNPRPKYSFSGRGTTIRGQSISLRVAIPQSEATIFLSGSRMHHQGFKKLFFDHRLRFRGSKRFPATIV